MEKELEAKRNQIENLLRSIRAVEQQLKDTQDQCFCHEHVVEVSQTMALYASIE